MRIVIPGGSGQVGTILARALSAAGHDIVVLSRTPSAAPWRVVAWDAEHDAADVAWDAEQDATPAGAGASWPDEDGGCGCRVQGRPESRPALETFAALLGAFILRRVRRRRGASESPRS